jgi:hypothetical protein
VVHGEPIACVASSAHVSVRTIRRWAASRGHGESALDASGRAMLRGLTREVRERIECDLASSPRSFGIEQEYWSGTALMRRLKRRYGLRLSARPLPPFTKEAWRFARTARARHRRSARGAEGSACSLQCAFGLSDQTRLRRMQRLASSGLPWQTFLTTLLDLIEDAIPTGPKSSILVRARLLDGHAAAGGERIRFGGGAAGLSALRT